MMNERRVFLCMAGVDQICLEQGQEPVRAWGEGTGRVGREGQKQKMKGQDEPAETESGSL